MPGDTVREMEAADWASLSDEELLERRISKLGLRLEGTPLEPLIKQLYDELRPRALTFHLPCHIGAGAAVAIDAVTEAPGCEEFITI